ncbi:HES1 [Mytilus coruscus]|uniref:HES1 n=1 Tax=Mytilus coruscus TaxID=42192 RepID=A0A6J8CY02_MYTCO|nr:HES1 [Mytilus coruscus]
MKFTETESQQKRKTSKPVTERRRRERINNSLMQLKSLVLRGTNKEEHVKMEKADIMDMAVRYIEDHQQRQVAEEQEKQQLTVQSFLQGYSTCIHEVSRHQSIHGYSNEIVTSLSNHLSSTLTAMSPVFPKQNLMTCAVNSLPGLPIPRPESRASTVNDDRFAASTPNSFYSADSNACQQLSPAFSGNTWYNTSPIGNLSYSHNERPSSVSPSTPYLWPVDHACNDSGFHGSPVVQSPANHAPLTSVWRPW